MKYEVRGKDKLSLVLSFIPSLIFSRCRDCEVPVLMVRRTAYTTHYLLTGDLEFFKSGSEAA